MKHTPIERPIRRLTWPLRRLQNIEAEPATKKILRESVLVLIFSCIVSSLGGLGMEWTREKLLLMLPVLIIMPAMNEMIGGFGTIIASKFTTLLYTGHVPRKSWWSSPFLHKLFINAFCAAIIAALYLASLAYLVGYIKGFPFDALLFLKIVMMTLIATILLITVLFSVSIVGGLYVHKKKHDPDNYLIPLATGIADFGSMLVLSIALIWFF